MYAEAETFLDRVSNKKALPGGSAFLRCEKNLLLCVQDPFHLLLAIKIALDRFLTDAGLGLALFEVAVLATVRNDTLLLNGFFEAAHQLFVVFVAASYAVDHGVSLDVENMPYQSDIFFLSLASGF